VYLFRVPTSDHASVICAPRMMGLEPSWSGPAGGIGSGGPGRIRRGIDGEALRRVAAITGGTYCPAESASDLEPVFASLPTSLVTAHETSFVFVTVAGLLSGAGLLLARPWRPLL
jgi:hypothetical protein